MAAAARKLYQQREAVYGNLAYDLERELRERELSHAGEERREAVRPKVKETVVPKTAVRQRQKVSVLSVLGFMAVGAMAVLVLLSNVTLTALSADVVELKNQLSVLDTDHVTLSTQYQRIYDLSSVKEAAEAAGMVKPRASQVYYVDLSGGDSAVAHQKREPSVLSKAAASLSDVVQTVMEYFN